MKMLQLSEGCGLAHNNREFDLSHEDAVKVTVFPLKKKSTQEKVWSHARRGKWEANKSSIAHASLLALSGPAQKVFVHSKDTARWKLLLQSFWLLTPGVSSRWQQRASEVRGEGALWFIQRELNSCPKPYIYTGIHLTAQLLSWSTAELGSKCSNTAFNGEMLNYMANLCSLHSKQNMLKVLATQVRYSYLGNSTQRYQI